MDSDGETAHLSNVIRLLKNRSISVATSILELQQRAYSEEARIIGIECDSFPPLSQTAQDITKSRDSFVGYFRDEVLLGVISWETRTRTEWSISRFVVEPSETRKGIGALLMYELLFRSVVPGIETIIVSTAKWNEPAVRFYRGWGFEVVSETRSREGVELQEWRLVRGE